jgi:hypothetical protein
VGLCQKSVYSSIGQKWDYSLIGVRSGLCSLIGVRSGLCSIIGVRSGLCSLIGVRSGFIV